MTKAESAASRTPRTTGELVLQHAALPGIARGSTGDGMRLLELGGTTHYAAGNIYLSALCVINHLQNEAADLREQLAFAERQRDDQIADKHRILDAYEKRLAKAREEAIEECAIKCDEYALGGFFAAKLRALSQKGADHE